jgi:3-phosphoshikimate 1-carboxyvinyltransferase
MSDLSHPLPDRLEIRPLKKPPVATIQVPGSKSITNRALVLACLSAKESACDLRGALRSEDTEIMIACLQHLGFRVETDWTESIIHVDRNKERTIIPAVEADLFVGNSGTTMRFLTALVTLGHGRYRLDGIPRMRQRPIEDLLSGLRQLGVKAASEAENGFPPVIIESTGLKGGKAKIKADVSSQFLSGLLMVSPFAQHDVAIDIEGKMVSNAYVLMTIIMMERLGLKVDMETTLEFAGLPTDISPFAHFQIPRKESFQAKAINIEPDATAASYFFGAAAISQGEVSVPGIDYWDSIQGDTRFASILGRMGCQVSGEGNLKVKGGPLSAIDEEDMNDMSDCVMTLAAVACFAEGPTTIRNVAHIRYKETDRLKALANELRKVGAEVEEFPDGLKITPRPLHGAEIETYNDHRMAMSMALIGLKVPGIVIRNPGCVAKTYPRFFEDLELLRK